MELRQLRYFILLARELNFSRAAEKLNISQPTLSQQIAALEAELGGKLFVRNKREVSLTETGKVLMENGEDLLYQFDSLVSKLHAMNNAPDERDEISIGVDTNDHDLDRWNVIRNITEIHRIRPRAEFRLVTVPFKSIRTALDNHNIDVGYYTIPKGEDLHLDVRYRVLRHDKIAIGVPNEYIRMHPGAELKEMLADLPVCMLEGDLRWNSYFEDVLRTYNNDLQIKYFNSDGLLFDYIAAGLGMYLDTETLFHMKCKYPVTPVIIEDDSVGAIEIVVWNDDNPNELRDMMFSLGD